MDDRPALQLKREQSLLAAGEMKQQQGKKAQATQVAAGKAKRKNNRKQQSKPTGGWQKVDLDDVKVDGFEDGCAFELEELTDYQLHKTEGGGQMLVSR